MEENHKYVYRCEAHSHFLPIYGVLTWKRSTVNFLRTTIMLTVYWVDTYFVYIKFAHEFASRYRYCNHTDSVQFASRYRSTLVICFLGQPTRCSEAKGGLSSLKNGMCTLYVWNTYKFGYCLHCTKTTSTLTIVIEPVGKILFWQKKNTNSYLKRHLAPCKTQKKKKNNKIYLFLMYHFFFNFGHSENQHVSKTCF